VNSIAPGALNTRLLDEVLMAVQKKSAKLLNDRLSKKPGRHIPGRRATRCLSGINGETTVLPATLSAVWDPWDTLPAHLEDLQQTDVYTTANYASGSRLELG
jgi:hypothetical protein